MPKNKPKSGDSGPHFANDGKVYYIVNGQQVWASSSKGVSGSTGTSTHAFAQSVTSKFESRDAPPRIRAAATYPPTASQGPIRSRLTQGYGTSRYRSGASQCSAPAVDAFSADPFRVAMDETKTQYGPPLDSEFVQRYNLYKDLDVAAESAEAEYRNYVKATGKVSQKIQRQNPDLYGGDPRQTIQWHDTAARYASLARDKSAMAADSRRGVNNDFIGYDKPKDARGHKKRVDGLDSTARLMGYKSNEHSTTHGRK